MTLRAGMCAVDITPPIGTAMAGYGAREGVSVEIHDPLEATAAVFENDGVTAAIVSLDLSSVDAEFVRTLQRSIAERCPIEPDSVIVAATHTHSGPLIQDRFGYVDTSLRDVTARKAAEAVAQAWAQRADTRLSLATEEAPGIAANRRDADVAVEPRVVIWRLDGSALTGMLYSFACHPTVLGHRNLALSADFPGEARRVLRSIYGGSLPVAFLNGAAGDISTRFTRRGADFAEAGRFGRLLAATVVRAAEQTASLPRSDIQTASVACDLPARSLPNAVAAQAEVARLTERLNDLSRRGAAIGDIRTAEVNVQGARGTLRLIEHGRPTATQVHVKAVRVGSVIWVAIPGELFSGVGKRIVELDRSVEICVVGYAEGYVGYIPTREAYAGGGYEIGVTGIGPGADDAIVDAASRVISIVRRHEAQ